MKIFNSLKGTILSLVFLLVLSNQVLHARVRFIENKGQWNPLVRFRADVPGTTVFLGNHWIRYAFVSAPRLQKFHAYVPFQKDDVDYQSVFLEFVNPQSNVQLVADSVGYEYYNYYYTKDQSRWVNHAKPYFRITYRNLFQGISLKVESEGDAIKHTYLVGPHENVNNIQYKIKGADALVLSQGDLLVKCWLGQIQELKPYAYQEYNGQKQEVKCNYVIKGDIVSFEFPDDYNHDLPLIVDPTMIFATYSGSYADNFGFTGTYDKEGNGYSGGTTYSRGFPAKLGKHKAYDTTFNGGNLDTLVEEGYYSGDIGILKYNKTGDSLLFATYIGGNGYEQPNSMVVDSQDRLIVFGNTCSDNFPVTTNAWQTKYGDSCDIYVCKLSRNGDSMLACTYVGGGGPDGLNGVVYWDFNNNFYFQRAPLFYNYGDQARGEVIVDVKGNIYVASSTMSKDFIDSGKFLNAYQRVLGGSQDACIFKLNSDMSKMAWCTLIGGANADAAYSLQRDSKGNIFVTGGTNSPYFFSDTQTYKKSLTPPISGSKLHENTIDAYVCSFKDDGTTLLNATYLGTSKYDQSYFVQLDKSDNVYLYGQTSSDTFPNFNTSYNNPKSGQFISEFNSSLDKLIRSATIGTGSSRVDISPSAFLVDDCGKIYISGWGGKVNSSDYGGHNGWTLKLPITSDASQNSTDGSDFYVALFAKNMDTMLYASFYGGNPDPEHVDGGTSRFDKRGVIYQSVCGGCWGLSNFPTTKNAWSRVNNGTNGYGTATTYPGCNNLLFKVDLSIPNLKANFDAPTRGCSPYTVKITNKTTNGKSFYWDFGDGTTSTLKDPPPHKYSFGGVYNLKLVVTNLYACTTKDSVTKQIQSYYKAKALFNYTKDTCNRTVYFDTVGTFAKAQKLTWNFGDLDTASGPSPTHSYNQSGKYKITLIADVGTPCIDSSYQYVTLQRSDFSFTFDTCSKIIKITNVSSKDSDYQWLFDGKLITAKLPVYTYLGSGKLNIKLIIHPKAPCDTISKFVTFPPLKKPIVKYVFDTCSHTVKITDFNPKDSTPIWVFGSDTIRKLLPTYTYPSAGKDTFTIILPNYCKGDTSKIGIVVPPKKKSSFTYTNPPCTRDFVFQALSFNPKYLWLFGDGTQDSLVNPPKHTYASDTSYNVTLVINAGKACADTLNKIIVPRKKHNAVFNFTIDSCTGLVYFLNKTDTAAKKFLWNFGDGSDKITQRNVNHYYAQDGDYSVMLIANPGNNCADTAKANFKLQDLGFDHLKISNVITPDGDGKNDVFTLSGINDKCMDFELEIFNRWGQLVYKQDGGPGQILSWNGTSLKGDPLAAGVYYWLIKGKAIGQKEGTVTIIR